LKTFRLRDDIIKLLEDIKRFAGLNTRTEALRYCIMAVHVLITSGAFEYIRPIPQLAQISLGGRYGRKRRR